VKPLRLLLLADLDISHTQKWAIALSHQGFQVMVIGLNPASTTWYRDIKGVQIKCLDISRAITMRGSGTFNKLVFYLRTLPKLKKLIRSFRPDILHAHYATSYGFLASVSGFHPWICSLWGTDVYSFPKKSFLNKYFFMFVLSRADKVCATSSAMVREARKYINREIFVTPFGINCEKFFPAEKRENCDNQPITVGTIKSLEPNYRIDILIRSIALILKRHPGLPLKLLIVGGGSQESELKSLAEQEGLGQHTIFTGYVPHEKVATYHRMLSVYVAVSESESFGVAVLEASACGVPVVVSNVGGLPEVVRDGETGFIVPSGDVEATISAIEKLVMNPSLRNHMGASGRSWVLDRYKWKSSVDTMLDVYYT